MAAFDLTTKPASLSLKPGSTGTIMVVVSNRLGKPVMAMVEGVLAPASVSKWLVPPPDLQRRYEADPAATVNYEFKVNVPNDTPAQSAQFKASVRDVMAPDDTRAEGQTVAINVNPDAVPPDQPKKIPWWVWLSVGLVLVGVGFGIFMAVRPRGVPKVMGMTVEKASAKLNQAGLAPTVVKDTFDGESKSIDRVVRQEPEAGDELPVDRMKWKIPATIVVNREAVLPPTGRTDMAVWRPSEGQFYVIPSATGTAYNTQWGAAGDIPVVRDYDGDGRADLAVWRPSTGMWSVVKSPDGTPLVKKLGALGDIPVPADYDGDGQTDMAVWRPSTGHWFLISSKDGTAATTQLGGLGDLPAPGDYDGDGRANMMVFHPGPAASWHIIGSNGKPTLYNPAWGTNGDVPMPADYDGDKRTDMAIWRPSTAEFWIIPSTIISTVTRPWGQPFDVAIPGDYDGDGRADLAVWRPSDGTWKLSKSSDGSEVTQRLGANGDIPVPGDFDAAPQ